MAFLLKLPRQQLLLALRRAGVALDDSAEAHANATREAQRPQGQGVFRRRLGATNKKVHRYTIFRSQTTVLFVEYKP